MSWLEVPALIGAEAAKLPRELHVGKRTYLSTLGFTPEPECIDPSIIWNGDQGTHRGLDPRQIIGVHALDRSLNTGFLVGKYRASTLRRGNRCSVDRQFEANLFPRTCRWQLHY